jgi:rhomboid protease GluP
MTADDDAQGGSGLFRWPDGFTLGVLIVCAAFELTFQLSDWGLLGSTRLRFFAYTYGGFWPGLLSDWRPNFPGQPVAMFLTYSVLHGGFLHFLVNMITLVSLGAAVSERGGTPRYAAIYVASILGGAAVYGLLAPGYSPMVGASGALFGLVGALVAWDTLERRALHLTMRPVLRVIVPRPDEPRPLVGDGRPARVADPPWRLPRRRARRPRFSESASTRTCPVPQPRTNDLNPLDAAPDTPDPGEK